MSLFELIEYPQDTLQKVALWPQRTFSLVYKCRTFFTVAVILIVIFCLTYNAAFQSIDFIKFSESLFLLISVVNCFIKLMMLTINGEEFLKLLTMLNAKSFQNYEQLYKFIIINFKKIIHKFQTLYRIQVNGIFVFMALFPVLESKPLPIDFPHFHNGTFHYPFYVFQLVSLSVAAHTNMALDLLTVGVISVAVIQLKILNNKLRDTEKNLKHFYSSSRTNVEGLFLVYLTECCAHYSDIEEFVKCLLRVFSINIFVQLGTSIVAICNSSIMILTVEPVSIEAAYIFLYNTTMFFQLGIYCWFGNMVYLESLEVGTSCYISQWYKHGSPIRKTLFMLMERSKRPLEIRGLRFVNLSFDTFIGILKWTYSYFTLLRNSMMKEH